MLKMNEKGCLIMFNEIKKSGLICYLGNNKNKNLPASSVFFFKKGLRNICLLFSIDG